LINYYQLLNLAPSAGEDEIRTAIKRELRVNSGRTNHPNLQKRQEAERKVEQLEQAEEILLDAAKRSEYDAKLRSAPAEVKKESRGVDVGGKDLVQLGWQLLIDDNVADAMFVAKKATEADGGNADAWALLGQAKFRWGEPQDAIYEYKRAIELRPNDGEFYYDLGCIYESIDQPGDALTQYQRAAKIAPTQTMYRAAIGALMVKHNEAAEGVRILEQCHQEDPENESYRWFLALAYHDRSIANWTPIQIEEGQPVQFFATEKAHLEEAKEYLDKAEALNVDDSELKQWIREGRELVDDMSTRTFSGNKIATALGFVFGIVAMFAGGSEAGASGILAGLYFIVVAILYILASRTPKYIVNRRSLQGKGGTSGAGVVADAIKEEGVGTGCVVAWFTFATIVLFMPIMAIRNYFKNYVGK
jgi:tetratricopeptide (TPR) repeat protein